MSQLPYICGNCGSQWPADRSVCAFCGGADRQANPAFGQPEPEYRYFTPPSQRPPAEYPQVSQTPYVVVTAALAVLIGVLVWWSLRGEVDGAFVYGLIAGALTAANVWICCLIYITKARVDRIGTVIDDVARSVHGR